MGGKSSAPAPDPRIAEAANRQLDLSEQQWADYTNNERPWMRGIAAQALGIQRSTADRSNALSDYQLGQMQLNDERYRNIAVPFENQLLQDVNRFDSQGYKDQQVSSAMGDVQQQFSNAAEQQRRGMARMGVNPNSGKMAAMSGQVGMEQAKAMASAANKTRMAADQIGLSSKMQMYGGMRGLAGLGNANAGLAMNSMGTGLQSAGSMNTSGLGMLSANNSAFNSAMGGMSAGATGLGNYAQLGMRSAEINNANDPTAALLGAGSQLGAAALGKWSDRRLKTDIVPVGVHARSGLNLYEFRYTNGSKRYRGVMADEVKLRYPDAVFMMPDGFMAVDYAAIGVEMTTVEGDPV